MFILGFVKLDRDIKKWKWFNKEPMLRVWIYLLSSASYEDNYYDGRLIKKGQLVLGRRKLSEILTISEQQARTCLKRLISTNEITKETTNKYSIITIVKWAEYQDKPIYINQVNNQDINQQSTNNQPTSNQQSTTTIEVKEVLEVKESLINNELSLSESEKIEQELERQENWIDEVDLFDTFESEFARPIAQVEVTRLGEWTIEYDKKLIYYALRESRIYDKKSFDYIQKILWEWKEKGFTSQDIESGKHHERGIE